MKQTRMAHKMTPSKPTFHAKNKHQGRYDFKVLTQCSPDLSKYLQPNKHGSQSIDFFDANAVKALNKALLKSYYEIDWDIPSAYLCPPIPGRADYLHHLVDLLEYKVDVKCLDIGVGANCIYPIVGICEYNWSFVGADIDVKAIASADKILKGNLQLKNKLELRLQNSPTNLFKNIIKEGEFFDVTMCNPPFHASKEDAEKGTLRKLKNLKGKQASKATLNFGGKSKELWCEGGEVAFVKNMILESKQYAKSCKWFTTLISKEANLKYAYKNLRKVKPVTIKTIQMGQGQKQSRILAWSFKK